MAISPRFAASSGCTLCNTDATVYHTVMPAIVNAVRIRAKAFQLCVVTVRNCITTSKGFDTWASVPG